MTPEEFTAAREKLGYNNATLARALGVSADRAAQTFSNWKRGVRNISPPYALLMQALLEGYRPEWMEQDQ